MPPSTRRRRLLKLAKRCVWWKPPAETLRDTPFFLAHVMTFGTWNDACALRSLFTSEKLRSALASAPHRQHSFLG